MMQNMCFIPFNVRKKIYDIPRLSVGFGSMNQVPSRLRIISSSDKHQQIKKSYEKWHRGGTLVDLMVP